MNVEKRLTLRVGLGALLIAAALAGWTLRCQDRAARATPFPTQTASPMAPVFPLVRLPGAYSDEVVEEVEFVIEPGQWLVVILDPGEAGQGAAVQTVRLPTAGTWLAAAAIAPAEELVFCQGPGDRDSCTTLLSLGRLAE